MNKVAEYRQNAADCRAIARKTIAPEHRQALLKMADAWDRLAEERSKTGDAQGD